MVLNNDQQKKNVRKNEDLTIINRIKCESRTGSEELMRMKSNRSSPAHLLSFSIINMNSEKALL